MSHDADLPGCAWLTCVVQAPKSKGTKKSPAKKVPNEPLWQAGSKCANHGSSALLQATPKKQSQKAEVQEFVVEEIMWVCGAVRAAALRLAPCATACCVMFHRCGPAVHTALTRLGPMSKPQVI